MGRTYTSSNTLAVSNRCRGMFAHSACGSFISSCTIAERISARATARDTQTRRAERASIETVKISVQRNTAEEKPQRTRTQPIRRNDPTLLLPLQRQRQPKRHRRTSWWIERSVDSLHPDRKCQYLHRTAGKEGTYGYQTDLAH